MNDPVGLLYETATFCKANDDKAPGLVGVSDFTTLTVCPEAPGVVDPVMDAVPELWYVRVMFDELLDPAVEELIPVDPMDPDTTYYGSLARTQPVILECGGAAVPYDGWYAPNGNNVTWPLGPSLVIVPDHSAVATSDTCQVTVRDTVVDKDGNQVPTDQRGPHDFGVGALAIAGSDPEPGGAEVATDGQILIFFNASLDPATVSAGTDVVITGPAAGGATVTAGGPEIAIDPPAAGWTAGDYTVTVPTSATITDALGRGTLTLTADYVIDFTVL